MVDISRMYGSPPAVDLKKIDLNLLVLFEAIYSTGAIGKAAERLHITQPAVSNGLKRLRELMDDPLFARIGRGITPTAKATQLIGPVREALGIISRQLSTGEAIDLATYKRHFRIVIVDALEPIIMPPILRQLGHQAPGITIEAVVGTRAFGDQLHAGTLDLAAFAYLIDAPEIRAEPIMPFDLVVISRRDHPALRKGLTLDLYRTLGHVGLTRELRALTHAEKDFVNQRVQRPMPYMMGKMWSSPAMIENTDFIGTLPRRFAEFVAQRYAIDIHEPPLRFAEQHLYLMWHKRNDDDPGHRWLRESMLEAAKAPTATKPRIVSRR